MALPKERRKEKGPPQVLFPVKLFSILQSVTEDKMNHIVSWQPHGRCFMMHRPQDFVKVALPHYFQLAKLRSFQRQLHLWGFQRKAGGCDQGAYWHPCFLRGCPSLLCHIVRVSVKGTSSRKRPNPEREPGFWNPPRIPPRRGQQLHVPRRHNWGQRV